MYLEYLDAIKSKLEVCDFYRIFVENTKSESVKARYWELLANILGFLHPIIQNNLQIFNNLENDLLNCSCSSSQYGFVATHAGQVGL